MEMLFLLPRASLSAEDAVLWPIAPQRADGSHVCDTAHLDDLPSASFCTSSLVVLFPSFSSFSLSLIAPFSAEPSCLSLDDLFFVSNVLVLGFPSCIAHDY